jgi:hypothetical protein
MSSKGIEQNQGSVVGKKFVQSPYDKSPQEKARNEEILALRAEIAELRAQLEAARSAKKDSLPDVISDTDIELKNKPATAKRVPRGKRGKQETTSEEEEENSNE